MAAALRLILLVLTMACLAPAASATYITNALYHENGLIESANYLNGQTLTQTLDARQKPQVLKTVKQVAR